MTKHPTKVIKANGRKILKFNAVNFPKSEKALTIECICFDETHNKFEPQIKEGHSYRLVNFDITGANKKFSTADHDFSIILKPYTELHCLDLDKNQEEEDEEKKLLISEIDQNVFDRFRSNTGKKPEDDGFR